jgi:beta-lactam-binding protein with PASTA domain
LSRPTPPQTKSPPDAWPTPEDETVVSREDTLVGTPPPAAPPPMAPPEAGPPADRRIGAGMLLGLGALALVAAGILIAWLLTHQKNGHNTTTVVVTSQANTPTLPPKVAVPRLIGLKEQQALVRIGQIGLRPKEIFRPTKQPKGVVVSQKPQEATEAARGSQVTLVIDSGAPKVAVPDLTGTPFTEAQAKLDQLGLSSTKTVVTSSQPAGTVVDQAPKPGGKLAKGSTVTLSVAKAQAQSTTPTTTAQAGTTNATTTGATTTPTTTAASAPPPPRNATMPDVTGQKEAAAVTSLGNAGILASLVFVPGTDPLGTVAQQAKPAGTTVPYHSHVQLNISRGPNASAQATVPNVVGQTLPQAVSTLNAAHLRLIYLKFPVTSRAQAGKVVQQSPLAGGTAPQNAQVVVYLGAFKTG